MTRRNEARASAQVRQIVGGEIRQYPREDDLLEAEVSGSVTGLMKASGDVLLKMVAGAGFEPATFGL